MTPLIIGTAAFAGPIEMVGVHVADHSVAPPFGNVLPTGSLRPAVTVEAESPGLAGRHLRLAPAARATGYHHRNAGSGWRLGAAVSGRATWGLGPFAELSLELGVAHTLFGRTLALEDGRYVESVDPGRLGPYGAVVLGAGFDLGRRTDAPLSVVATYRWLAHAGWLPVTGVGPKSELGLGLRWSFSAKEA